MPALLHVKIAATHFDEFAGVTSRKGVVAELAEVQLEVGARKSSWWQCLLQ